MKRKELFELVWQKPMAILAKDFGLSDSGLAKRCRALQIPLPPRGHWAKLAIGKGEDRPALPSPDQDFETGLTQLSDDQRKARDDREAAARAHADSIRDAEQAAPQISLPKTLAGAHPLVRDTAKYVERIPALIARANRMRGNLAALPSREWPPSTTNGTVFLRP